MVRALIWLALAAALIANHASASNMTRVAVVDTGLDLTDSRFKGKLCDSGHLDFTGEGIADHNGHGTHVAGLIAQYAGVSNYCLIVLKVYTDRATSAQTTTWATAAFREVVRLGVDIVNYSGGGPVYDVIERKIIDDARHILWVVAAGNDGKDVRVVGYYPAAYRLPNVVVVGSAAPNGSPAESSNYGPVVTRWEFGEMVRSYAPNGGEAYMSGTSMATAIATGKLINGRLGRRER